jgi:hypothetical protein
MNNNTLSVFDLTIIGKYFNNFNDFINLIKTNKLYSNILDNYHYNPISLNQNLFKYFKNIETFHYYLPEDKHIHHKCNKYIDWTQIDISDDYYNFNENTEYKNLNITLKSENTNILSILNSLSNNPKITNLKFKLRNSSIREIDLNNLNVYSISGTIYYCTNLTYVNLKNTLDYNINIEECINLHDLNFIINNNKDIKFKTYIGNSSLSSVKLSTNITKINEQMFTDCSNLKKIKIENLNNLNNIQVLECYCFANCGFEKIELKNIRRCDCYAFNRCKQLKNITLLGSYASLNFTFNDCSNLTNVVIPKHVRTLNHTFMGCSNLEYIDLPTALTNINTAFMNCEKLKKIDLSKCTNLITISPCAFMNCLNLENVILPTTIKIIEYCAFQNCEKLKNIYNLDNCFINKICTAAFLKCTSLTSLTLNCERILNHAFEKCSSLESVILLNDVVLCNDAFKKCIKLKSVIATGILINKRTFDKCESLRYENIIHV